MAKLLWQKKVIILQRKRENETTPKRFCHPPFTLFTHMCVRIEILKFEQNVYVEEYILRSNKFKNYL